MPLDAPDGTIDGTYNYYMGPRWLEYRIEYGNNGPDAIPAGASVTLDLPYASLWKADSISVTADPNGVSPTFVGNQSVQYDANVPGAALWYMRWNFQLGRPIASGETFTITYRVWLTGATTPTSDEYRVRNRATFAVAATGAQDVNTTNNAGHSQAYTAYNSSTASKNA